MNRLVQRRLAQAIGVRQNSTYPVIGIEELQLKNRKEPLKNASVSLRDYFEWQRLSKILRRETFFTQRGKYGTANVVEANNDILLYEPIVTHCIAKWLLVNYKLNAYPYHDLNIVNIYADLRQSLSIIRTMMKYFKTVLSDTMFERIRVIMVPLYDQTSESPEELLNNIPGEVSLVTDNAIFLSSRHDGINEQQSFVIEDPVSILMFNDVIKYLPHDAVKYSVEKKQWEQGFLEFDNDGNKSLTFRNDIDFWCNFAIKKTVVNQIPDKKESQNHVYIPTRLAHLFEMIRKFAPHHRFLAVDEPQRWQPSISSIIKVLLGYQSVRGSRIIEDLANEPVFLNDFIQMQEMYMNINGLGKTSEINDLSEFVNKWINLGYDFNDECTADQLESKLKMINGSTLATIHSY